MLFYTTGKFFNLIFCCRPPVPYCKFFPVYIGRLKITVFHFLFSCTVIFRQNIHISHGCNISPPHHKTNKQLWIFIVSLHFSTFQKELSYNWTFWTLVRNCSAAIIELQHFSWLVAAFCISDCLVRHVGCVQSAVGLLDILHTDPGGGRGAQYGGRQLRKQSTIKKMGFLDQNILFWQNTNISGRTNIGLIIHTIVTMDMFLSHVSERLYWTLAKSKVKIHKKEDPVKKCKIMPKLLRLKTVEFSSLHIIFKVFYNNIFS